MKQYDVIVVGAGIAGLGSAALLAAKGKKILLLEKEPILGGRSTSFQFQGYTVDIGLHAIASFSSSGIGRLVEESGAVLELKPIKPALMHFDLDNRAFMRATSSERFGRELYQDFKKLASAVSRFNAGANKRPASGLGPVVDHGPLRQYGAGGFFQENYGILGTTHG